MILARRKVLTLGAGIGAASAVRALFGPFTPLAAAEPDPSAAALPAGVPASFPTQDPDLVREMVGVSHANLDRVRELVTAQPTLADATWDWGFGDWESALGAASHMGRRDIAALLLANGATSTLFSATMLGQIEVVRAFVATSPGVQRTLGPHGISLLRHAQAGGDESKPVLDFLTDLGDADPAAETVALTPDELSRYVGNYGFGAGKGDRLVVSVDDRGRLRVARGEGSPRLLFALGSDAFFPAGAPNVRIRFTMKEGRADSLSVLDPGVVLLARLAA